MMVELATCASAAQSCPSDIRNCVFYFDFSMPTSQKKQGLNFFSIFILCLVSIIAEWELIL